MKLTKSLMGILLVVITLASCSKTEKVLVKHDGKWNIDKQVTTTTFGGVSSTDTQTDLGVATFNDNGSGVITYNDGTTSAFNWVVVDDVITITYNDGSDVVIDFTILSDSGKDFQHWSGTYTVDFFGIITVVDTDLTLSSLD